MPQFEGSVSDAASGSRDEPDVDVIKYPAPTDEHLHSLHRYLTRRGWVVADHVFPHPGFEFDAESGWRYPASYGGITINDVDDATPTVLKCYFVLDSPDEDHEFVIISVGNYRGCEDHAEVERSFSLGEHDAELRFAELSVLLDELEDKARDTDPRELIECRFFGPCGRR